MRRGLTVLKMRGSLHDKDIREFTIDGSGLHIGPPFRTIFGIMSGNFRHVTMSELKELEGLLLEAAAATTVRQAMQAG